MDKAPIIPGSPTFPEFSSALWVQLLCPCVEEAGFGTTLTGTNSGNADRCPSRCETFFRQE